MPIEVTYDGTGPLYYRVDLGPWQELPLDDNGKAKIEAPVGASVILFSDRKPNPASASVEVIGTAPIQK